MKCDGDMHFVINDAGFIEKRNIKTGEFDNYICCMSCYDELKVIMTRFEKQFEHELKAIKNLTTICHFCGRKKETNALMYRPDKITITHQPTKVVVSGNEYMEICEDCYKVIIKKYRQW